MTFRVLIPLLLSLSACTGAQKGVGSANSGGSAAGADDGSAEAGPSLGSDCVGERGELANYFCGQKCSGVAGQKPGVNCGRACIGQTDEIRGGNCTPPMPFGGAYGRCLQEGEELEAKVIGALCCEGLERIGLEHPTANGCASDEPPSLFVCAACGDGTCGRSENSCNCEADCPP